MWFRIRRQGAGHRPLNLRLGAARDMLARMAWMILSDDGPDGPALRADAALMDAHWAYELSIAPRVLAAGSLRSDDGATPVGGLLILDVATRAEAEALFAADPASRAGLRTNVRMLWWNPAILGGVAQA